MKKSRKLLLSGALAFSATMPIISASCGKQSNTPDNPDKPAGEHSKAIPNERRVTGIELKDELKIAPEKVKQLPKFAVITDGGTLEDKTFNQSGWEALLYTAEQSGINKDMYTPIEVVQGKFEDAYIDALESGYKYWVLPGFLHQENIQKFFKTHHKKILDAKIKIIAIDFVLNLEYTDKDNNTIKPEGIGVSINFETKQGGFLAGYAAGEFLSTIYKEEKDRFISTLGGGNFRGVTDFNEGFYKGLMIWNERNKNDDTKKIYSTDEKVILDTGFAPSTNMTTQVEGLLSKNAKMILPVGGPLTLQVTRSSNFKNKDKFVIGVDTDQALQDSNGQKSRYFTSIIKKIGQSIYEVLSAILSGNKDLMAKYAGGFDGTKNVSLKKGIEDGWVGTAKTAIQGDQKAIAEKALKNALEAFNQLTENEKEFLNSDRVSLTDKTQKFPDINDIDASKRIDALSKALYKKIN
ncbi:BMP family ABC transporter substrate-binding protein [Mycoplasmopsis primatum]|uniref:BMP family ABC transporter substrate-binding protein n=1 Tax=Mycoplasmopsis primatum TaxID=55604 RepID=UPI000497CC6D|nr:BMP family ABC transporter substrate-binding protein [Mycoplasmopsis primatum]